MQLPLVPCVRVLQLPDDSGAHLDGFQAYGNLFFRSIQPTGHISGTVFPIVLWSLGEHESGR